MTTYRHTPHYARYRIRHRPRRAPREMRTRARARLANVEK
jgi:hypothetical protein